MVLIPNALLSLLSAPRRVRKLVLLAAINPNDPSIRSRSSHKHTAGTVICYSFPRRRYPARRIISTLDQLFSRPILAHITPTVPVQTEPEPFSYQHLSECPSRIPCSRFPFFFFRAQHKRRPRPQHGTKRKEHSLFRNPRKNRNSRRPDLLQLDHDPGCGIPNEKKEVSSGAVNPSRRDVAVAGWIRRETKCRLCTEHSLSSVACFVLFER